MIGTTRKIKHLTFISSQKYDCSLPDSPHTTLFTLEILYNSTSRVVLKNAEKLQ